MRKLIVSEYVTLDGLIRTPGGKDEDRDGGVERNTTIIRDNVIESVRELKAQPGKNILTDGGGKRLLPEKVYATFSLASATPYSTGVVGLHYVRARS